LAQDIVAQVQLAEASNLSWIVSQYCRTS